MDKIKKHIKQAVKNKHYWLSFCSSFVIALVVIGIVAFQTSVNASIANFSSIDDVLLQADAEDVLEEEFVETIIAEPEEFRNELVEVKTGDTFIKILTTLGLDYNESHAMFEACKTVFDPRNLKVGQKLEVKTLWSNYENKLLSVESLTSSIKVNEKLVVERVESGKYTAKIKKDILVEESKSIQGTINGTLSHSMSKYGVPAKIVANFINIFSYSVDFRRDLKKGDSFEIIYENYLTPDGQFVQTGNILYASLQLGKHNFKLYRFKDSSGNVDYYDAKGLAMKKTLSRKPMAFQSARISSPFGRRRHPIHGDIRIHWGIDYAAPKGSLIYAAGDGVVMAAKYNGAYGNYVKIRHNSEYSSAYGHMSKFAKGVKAGSRVKQGQVIGYVGSTGRSTGPHLHYEVIQNNRRVNPLTVRASASENLGGKNLASFKQQVASIDKKYKEAFAETKVAENTAVTINN